MERRNQEGEALELRDFQGTVDAAASETGKLVGYAAIWDTPSQEVGDGKRKWREVLKRGAFAESIQEGRISLAFQHDLGRVLANQQSGTLQLVEDEKGLRFEADIGNGPTAQDVRDAVRRGVIRQMSFGFTVPEGGDSRQGAIRTISRLRAREISLVERGAWTQTSAEARSAHGAGKVETMAKKKISEMNARELSAHCADLDAREAAAQDDAAKLQIRAEREEADERRAEILATGYQPSARAGAPVKRELETRSEYEQAKERLASPEYRKEFDRWMQFGGAEPKLERRDLLTTSSGGVLAPLAYEQKIVKYRDAAIGVRGTVNLETNFRGVRPKRVNTQDGAAYAAGFYTTEATPTAAQYDAAHAKVDFAPIMGLAESRLSTAEVISADFDAEAEVVDDLGRKLAKGQEFGYCQGSGSNQPFGIFTWQASLVNSLQLASVAHGGGTGWDAAITQANLGKMRYSLLPASYAAGAAWWMSQAAFALVAMLTDTSGRLLLTDAPGAELPAGATSRLLGLPVYVTEFGPGRLTAAGSNCPIALGNWKEVYTAREWGGLPIIRDEVTVPGRIRFVIQPVHFGQYVLPKAVSLLKITLT